MHVLLHARFFLLPQRVQFISKCETSVSVPTFPHISSFFQFMKYLIVVVDK